MRTWLGSLALNPPTGPNGPDESKGSSPDLGEVGQQCGRMPAGEGSESDGVERPFKRLPVNQRLGTRCNNNATLAMFCCLSLALENDGYECNACMYTTV